MEPTPVLFGEVDGRITERTRRVARILESGWGMTAEVRTDMDTWLRYHVALLMPALVPALYAAETDNYRLARTRDLLVLTVRGVREGFRVLRSLGLPVTPARFRIFQWLPEPVVVLMLRRLLADELMETAMVAHAEAARDEMRHLADEFQALARSTPVKTPVIDRLYPYFDPQAPVVPEGQAEIPMRWGGMMAGTAILVAAVAGGVLLWRKIVHPAACQESEPLV